MKIKQIFLLFFITLLTFGATAAPYTVATLPNVHLQDSTKFLVNPDGIIPADVSARIDSLLCDAQRQSSAEVVAVIVNEIDGEVNDFATNLFKTWGVGKKDVNNGIVILVAKDSRQGVIRTGYGAEGLLPDVICKRILRNTMSPLFKEGDYAGGMLAGVTEVHDLVTDPAAVEELMTKGDKDGGGGNGMLYGLLAVVGVAGAGIAYKISRANKCKKCGKKMVQKSEEETYQALSPQQKFEKDHNACTFRLMVCPECGEEKLTSTPVTDSPYCQCPKCQTYAYHYRKPVVSVAPTHSAKGKAEQWGDCEYCKHSELAQTVDIPKGKACPVGAEFIAAGCFLAATGLMMKKSNPKSTSSSSGSSSSNPGGTFGGGSTGGGGASHSW